MWSFIELNDTLQITKEQWFPWDILNLEKHRVNPIDFSQVKDRIFEFYNKPWARIFHTPPTRVFLAENRDWKWIYWWKCFIIEQTIKWETKENCVTCGKYRIIEIYDPVYQEQMTKRETEVGKSYF